MKLMFIIFYGIVVLSTIFQFVLDVATKKRFSAVIFGIMAVCLIKIGLPMVTNFSDLVVTKEYFLIVMSAAILDIYCDVKYLKLMIGK